LSRSRGGGSGGEQRESVLLGRGERLIWGHSAPYSQGSMGRESTGGPVGGSG
jgi:hypothetical protein